MAKKKNERKSARRLTLAQIGEELAEVARVGQVFMDGDWVRGAYFPHAQAFMTGDDMDFDPAACVPLKKTLMRLERLSRVPCSSTVWRRRPDVPSSGEAVHHGFMGSPQAGAKPGNRGYEPPKMSKELAAAFKGRMVLKVDRRGPGARILHARGRGVPARGVKGYATVQVYAPVKDSMGEVAGVLELWAAAVGSGK